jgi:DNA-directed RNA polymerase specialized sigma24 family protein
LAQQYEWKLVEDEERFLDLAATEARALTSSKASDYARIAIWRAYSTLLYRGLWQRENRAAQEIWLMCARMALRDGFAPAEAEELAQETVTRALAKLHDVRAPQSMITWVLTILRTVRRERRQQAQHEQSLAADEQEPAHEPSDPTDLTQTVEQRVIGAALQAELRTALPNNLEREVLLRVVVWDDRPRDVARDLGLPLHRTRLAKHRALNRLRNNPAFLQVLSHIAGDVPPNQH